MFYLTLYYDARKHKIKILSPFTDRDTLISDYLVFESQQEHGIYFLAKTAKKAVGPSQVPVL